LILLADNNQPIAKQKVLVRPQTSFVGFIRGSQYKFYNRKARSATFMGAIYVV